jgi:transposase
MRPRRSSYSVNEVKQGIRSYFILNSFRKAAVAVGVPKSTLCDWVNNIGRRLRSTRRHRYVVRERTILINQVRTLLMQNPFHTLYTLKHELGDVSIATLHRAVKKAGISYQQVSWRTPPRDMTHELAAFFAEFRTLVDSGVKVLSIDETGFISNRYPSKGYGIRGQRLRVSKVHRKRIKVTSIAAIHDSGMMSDTFEGNANGHSFAFFVRRLFSTFPNSVAILDNIAFHKSALVRSIADEFGVRLMFTPPYSPECNPIEHAFSVCKRIAKSLMLRSIIESGEDFVHEITAMLQSLADFHDFVDYFGPRSRETTPNALVIG